MSTLVPGAILNNGLTSGTPLLTLQAAANRLLQNYNLNGYTATISCTGAFPQGCIAYGAFPGGVGPGSVVFNFAGGSTVTSVNQPCFAAAGAAQFTITGPVVLSATGSSGYGAGYAIFSNAGCTVAIGTSLSFSTCATAHIAGAVIIEGSYNISGSTAYHLVGVAGTQLLYQPATFGGSIVVTVLGGPTFSGSFAFAPDGSVINCQSASTSFSGSANGKRYNAIVNGIIDTQVSGATFFPGSISGTVSNGGVYY